MEFLGEEIDTSAISEQRGCQIDYIQFPDKVLKQQVIINCKDLFSHLKCFWLIPKGCMLLNFVSSLSIVDGK